MSVEIPLLVSVGSLAIATLTYLNNKYKENAKLRERIQTLEEFKTDAEKYFERTDKVLEKLDTCMRGNSEKITRLDTKMELFWNSMSDYAAQALHHPETPEIDALLDKWRDRSISIAEMERLRTLLAERVAQKIGKQENGEVYWMTFLISRLTAKLMDFGSPLNVCDF